MIKNWGLQVEFLIDKGYPFSYDHFYLWPLFNNFSVISQSAFTSYGVENGFGEKIQTPSA